MSRIQILQDNIINLIAAGEVVERPASVVKELLENALDAGASEVIIRIEQGGIDKISVTDNGSGMAPADAELAFTQHATSKIASEQDLQRIHTFGFRGEALASISSVAGVVLETKAERSEASRIEIDAVGAKQAAKSAKATVGTTITISGLFGPVPARRKFLKSAATEFTHIQNTFIASALTNLDAHLELYHNDKLVYRLPKAKDMQERIFSLWGEQVSTNMYVTAPSDSPVSLQLLIGKPDIARGDRKLQFLFVNKRPVSDRLLQRAISEAFKGFIHRDLQPVYFVMLQLDPDLVDVNVHPRKLEVRFQNGQQIYSLVYNGVRNLLEGSTKRELLGRVSEMSTGPVAQWTLKDSAAGGSEYLAKSSPRIPNTTPIGTPSKGLMQHSLDFSRQLSQSGLENTQTSDIPSAHTDTAPTQLLQLFATYIVYQQAEDVIFIDQHAAAEKILYEKLQAQASGMLSQPLLVPHIIELSSQDKQAVLDRVELLTSKGLEIADFGGHSIQVLAVPQLTPNLDVERLLQQVAAGLEDSEQQVNNPNADLVLATMACHAAVRAGQMLSSLEMQQIIKDLSHCQNPYNCPHGRPVSWVLTRRELEKNFKRII